MSGLQSVHSLLMSLDFGTVGGGETVAVGSFSSSLLLNLLKIFPVDFVYMWQILN